VEELAKRTITKHCSDDVLASLHPSDSSNRRPSNKRRSAKATSSSFFPVMRFRCLADDESERLFQGICRSFRMSYDIQAILRDDAEFRDAVTALFRMTGASSSSASPPLTSPIRPPVPRPVFEQFIALSSSNYGASEEGDLTVIFLRVREDGLHDLILPALVRGGNVCQEQMPSCWNVFWVWVRAGFQTVTENRWNGSRT
jgi:hypothetical protein